MGHDSRANVYVMHSPHQVLELRHTVAACSTPIQEHCGRSLTQATGSTLLPSCAEAACAELSLVQKQLRLC